MTPAARRPPKTVRARPHAPLLRFAPARAAPRSVSGGDLANAPAPVAFPASLLAEYELEGMIGQGSFGTVVAARRREPAGVDAACAPARVAVKILSKLPPPAGSPPRLGGVLSVTQDQVEDCIAEEVRGWWEFERGREGGGAGRARRPGWC